MNKRIFQALYPVLLIFTGIILALSSALVSGTSVSAGAKPELYFDPKGGIAALSLGSTPTPVAGAVSRAGSTDGIMVMGVVIVVIVLLPILLRRSTWTK